MANYNEQALKALTAAIGGNQSALEWRHRYSFVHLLALYDAIVRKSGY